MAVICEECVRTFGTREALQQHLRDSPIHAVASTSDEDAGAYNPAQALEQRPGQASTPAVTLRCNECVRTFGTEEALQQHLRDSRTHASKFGCTDCVRSFDTEQALQQHLRDSPVHRVMSTADIKRSKRSFALQPSLHDEVLESLRVHDLIFDFCPVDNARGALKEHDTGIMGKFTCPKCHNKWTSKQIAITIRLYPGQRYNARVYFQRCERCKALGRPQLDSSYAERVSYRLAAWSGIALEPPPYSGHNRRPHQSDLCEGCQHGHCQLSRL